MSCHKFMWRDSCSSLALAPLDNRNFSLPPDLGHRWVDSSATQWYLCQWRRTANAPIHTLAFEILWGKSPSRSAHVSGLRFFCLEIQLFQAWCPCYLVLVFSHVLLLNNSQNGKDSESCDFCAPKKNEKRQTKILARTTGKKHMNLQNPGQSPHPTA